MKGDDLAMKKVLIVLMIFALCVSNIAAYADNNGIVPYNTTIVLTNNKLTIDTSGKANCYGKTAVQNGYKAGITIELQQYTNKWHTIKTWDATNAGSIALQKYYYVESGYSYQLKLTHKAYDSNGKTVETIVKYSNVVKY